MSDAGESRFTVEIGGEERVMEFNFHAIRRYNQYTGKNLLAGGIDDKDVEDLIALIWAGLLVEMPEFDGEILEVKKGSESVENAMIQVGKWMNPVTIRKITPALAKAIGGEAEESEGKKEEGAQS